MLQKLQDEPQKVPSPSKDEMMTMISNAWDSTTQQVDPISALKQNFLLNALDGSEDWMVRDSLFELVGEEIKEFRVNLMKSPPPKALRELISTITPPKGVKIKATVGTSTDEAPADEGMELMDCDGEEINHQEDSLGMEDEDEEIEQNKKK